LISQEKTLSQRKNLLWLRGKKTKGLNERPCEGLKQERDHKGRAGVNTLILSCFFQKERLLVHQKTSHFCQKTGLKAP
jgi:hypothetical protein